VLATCNDEVAEGAGDTHADVIVSGREPRRRPWRRAPLIWLLVIAQTAALAVSAAIAVHDHGQGGGVPREFVNWVSGWCNLTRTRWQTPIRQRTESEMPVPDQTRDRWRNGAEPGDISGGNLEVMMSEAQQHLDGVQPIDVTISGVLYHPEAIMLGFTPEGCQSG
jgi:hypothetical protein